MAVLNFRFKLDDALRTEYKRLRLTPPPTPLLPLEFGKVFCPPYSYADSRTAVSASTLFSAPSALRALACIARTWHEKIKGTLFMDMSFVGTMELPCSLEAFKVGGLLLWW